ncbi:MAG: hypothetical protein J6S85_03405 [Methanobrevibacter sp.]|nr:hypothetical protein [Methanobrevibacter sp.]
MDLSIKKHITFKNTIALTLYVSNQLIPSSLLTELTQLIHSHLAPKELGESSPFDPSVLVSSLDPSPFCTPS